MNNSHWALKCIDSEAVFAIISKNKSNDFDKRLLKAIKDEYGLDGITLSKPVELELNKIEYPDNFNFKVYDEEGILELTLYPTWEY